jgi:HK97 gp10 family phage protein
MKASFKILGTKELMQKLSKYSDKVTKGIRQETERFAVQTTHDAKQNLQAAVYSKGMASATDLTGQLKTMIQFDVNSKGATILVPVSYAPYVEFGTGTKVNVPKGLENYASQFKGKGIKQINLSARPFLFPAVEKNSKIFFERVKKLLEP